MSLNEKWVKTSNQWKLVCDTIKNWTVNVEAFDILYIYFYKKANMCLLLGTLLLSLLISCIEMQDNSLRCWSFGW